LSASPSPDDFALAKEGDEEDAQVKAQAQNDTGEQISAADYDPNQDRREDEGKRAREVKQEGSEDVEMIEVEDEDDVDDMFAVTTAERKKVRKIKKVIVSTFCFVVRLFDLTSSQKPPAPALITTTLDSAADSEGYYSIILGEQLDGGRYQVFSSLGKGMFANVVRARVLTAEVGEVGKEVAIKIVRCQESM
jgi:serine/threonine-protein kinase PRP4